MDSTPREYVRPAQPRFTSSELSCGRGVLPGILESMVTPISGIIGKSVLFEIGPVFLTEPGSKLPAGTLALNTTAMMGTRTENAWSDSGQPTPPPLDFFDLKGIVGAARYPNSIWKGLPLVVPSRPSICTQENPPHSLAVTSRWAFLASSASQSGGILRFGNESSLGRRTGSG